MTESRMDAPAADSPTPAPAPRPVSWRRRLKRLVTSSTMLFAVTVALPTAGAAVYYGLIASDRYVSESRFVVRNPQRASPSGIGALLQGTVFSRSQDDTYSVHDYILSRDALKELEGRLEIGKGYADPAIDFWNRFPGLDGDDSFEALHRHYLNHVHVTYDTVSSISVLRVQAYTSADAQRVNDLLLQMGERLVNNLNARSRRDLIEVAETEVRAAEVKSRATAAALSSFRSSRSVFDPERQGTQQLATVARLRQELSVAQGQLDALRRVAPNNPQIPLLTQEVDRVKGEIARETSVLLGEGRSLTNKAPEYDRLLLEKTFADRQLAAALGALDTARNEAARKQLYLERLVQPNLPDVAVEPRRLRAVATVFVVGLLVWGVAGFVLASVREHAD
jgi:capsular polysaccharide transport system permease protein